MNSTEVKALMGVGLFAAVFAVPVAMFYFAARYGLDTWIATAVSVLAIIVGGALAVGALAIAYGALGEDETYARRMLRKIREEYEEKELAYSARQRAMLEELDEIAELLREIRDLLKGEYDETRRY